MNSDDLGRIEPIALPDNNGDQETIAPVRLPAGRGGRSSIDPVPVDASSEKPAAPRPERQKPPIFGWLVVLKGQASGVRFDLPEGENKIGRSSHCAVRIVGDEDVSREHAMVRVKGKEFLVCDLASRNGSLLNGVRIERGRLLQDGDTLQVGKTVFIFKRA
jgi:pSer/pThr/pTyr-binding forkhead associated (FHA) protein